MSDANPAILANLIRTAKKTAGDWLHMGDIGHLDADGWLFFHYRMGGGIRKNGDFINTAFVEKPQECFLVEALETNPDNVHVASDNA